MGAREVDLTLNNRSLRCWDRRAEEWSSTLNLSWQSNLPNDWPRSKITATSPAAAAHAGLHQTEPRWISFKIAPTKIFFVHLEPWNPLLNLMWAVNCHVKNLTADLLLLSGGCDCKVGELVCSVEIQHDCDRGQSVYFFHPSRLLTRYRCLSCANQSRLKD